MKGCTEIFSVETPDTFYNKTKDKAGGILYDKYIDKRRILKDLGMITCKKAKNEGIFILKYYDLCITMYGRKIFEAKSG